MAGNTPGPAGPRGTNRRKGERRKGGDRRDMIRFEPGKGDRRGGKDRRRQNGWDSVR